eukprot:scaffold7112_cov155-Amphora_coffeaeformis.AAC.2
MKERKEQKENSREKVQSIGTAQGNDGKDFGEPNNTEHHECQCLVTVIKFDKKEDHPHHDGTKYQIVNKVPRDQIYDGLSIPHMILQLMGKVQHAFLRFSESKGNQGSGNKE